ncbi:hypothetical protein CANMA_002656 [Candida margitis]|uniref:uncharacterized protein n=1 Tax=Candida margitis TaxID=1775924 RepID=UPI0022269E24|nr:uncharacterized protein CANMA_002656 [Candida margitis]KAI5967888.1 hypothetical protein CANMA_002656 [Candida margitis]
MNSDLSTDTSASLNPQHSRFDAFKNIPRLNQYLENKRIEKLEDQQLKLEYEISNSEFFLALERDKLEQLQNTKVFVDQTIEVMVYEVIRQSHFCFNRLFHPSFSYYEPDLPIPPTVASAFDTLVEMMINHRFAEDGMIAFALKFRKRLERKSSDKQWDIEDYEKGLNKMNSKLTQVKEKLKELMESREEREKEEVN